MNFPVLFRTIDGASQATIETQYATELLRQSDWYGKCRRPRFSFFKKDINLWFVLTYERVFDPVLCLSAGDRRRPLACMETSVEVTMRSARWARSSVG